MTRLFKLARLSKLGLTAGVPVALALAAVLTATPAAAQLDNVSKAQKNRTPADTGAAPLAPPPALPGASSKANQAIPSDKLATDMSPNDALFDAINRGDIGDARDAIKRGAELTARNVLGLTPIDLSVDLSRNDITFMMLSLRGTPTAGSGPKIAAAGGAAKPGAKSSDAKSGKTLPTAASHKPKPTIVAAPTPPPQRQQLVSSDPGRPAPQAGFLGFGGAPQP
jgi:hypothetical protein